MRIAVITCDAYKDAIPPFKELFDKFWPDCPYSVSIYSEAFTGEAWCAVVKRCAEEANEPILMMQDDAWLTAPVEGHLVKRGLELLESQNAGCVRLYPSPGGTVDFADEHFALVPKGTVNRISCMPAIWTAHYLYEIARRSYWTTGEAGDFENLGTPASDDMTEPVLAFKRDATPWPMQILNAIARRMWNPDAIRLCQQYGIPVDRSKRLVSGHVVE